MTDTTPSPARARLERCCGQPTPPELIADLDAYRAEVLAEAAEAVNALYRQGTITAYNEGVFDAAAALYRLTKGGVQ